MPKIEPPISVVVSAEPVVSKIIEVPKTVSSVVVNPATDQSKPVSPKKMDTGMADENLVQTSTIVHSATGVILVHDSPLDIGRNQHF